MPRLECQGVHFAYGRSEALRGVDLSAEAGTVCGVIGPNGAGKSTLLRLAAGLCQPSRGVVRIEGKQTTELKPRDLGRLLGYVPQSFSLPFPFRVLEVVLQGRSPHLVGPIFESRHDLEVAREAMERTGIWSLRERPFDSLSGGERQRAVIAAALAQEPRLLVLDEPTSSLDLRFQGTTVALLRELVETRDLSVVVALHDLNVAAALCDRLVLLVQGRIEASGPPSDVLQRELLERAYETRLHVGHGPNGPYVLPLA